MSYKIIERHAFSYPAIENISLYSLRFLVMTKFIYRQKLKLKKESPTKTHKIRFKQDIEKNKGSYHLNKKTSQKRKIELNKTIF